MSSERSELDKEEVGDAQEYPQPRCWNKFRNFLLCGRILALIFVILMSFIDQARDMKVLGPLLICFILACFGYFEYSFMNCLEHGDVARCTRLLPRLPSLLLQIIEFSAKFVPLEIVHLLFSPNENERQSVVEKQECIATIMPPLRLPSLLSPLRDIDGDLKIIEISPKVMPPEVVRRLLSPKKKERQSVVEKQERIATIMFCEGSLPDHVDEETRLFAHGEFCKVAILIIESHGGLVSENMPDKSAHSFGLLCYWIAHADDDATQAEKACIVAELLRQACSRLNCSDEFARRKLEVQIRIGMNTGAVIAGLQGCPQKMKYGCTGDPVNETSRIQGQCKKYNVPIILTGATREKLAVLSESVRFVTRRLDFIQVKGKAEPTDIFELVGFKDQYAFCGPPSGVSGDIEAVTPTTTRRVKKYEKALQAYQRANFKKAIRFLHDKDGQDVAADKLLNRARPYAKKLADQRSPILGEEQERRQQRMRGREGGTKVLNPIRNKNRRLMRRFSEAIGIRCGKCCIQRESCSKPLSTRCSTCFLQRKSCLKPMSKEELAEFEKGVVKMEKK